MHVDLPYERLLLLTEGRLGTFSSKTASAILRYRRNDVVGVLDSVYAGQAIETLLDNVTGVPIFRSVEESLALRPDGILIGIAPTGGALPDRMRHHLLDGLRHGLSIVSGLHTNLSADREFAEAAATSGAKIHDVRDAGPIDRIARGRARHLHCKRVLTVGTDCNVGKMVTALELTRAARAAGIDAAFVATGQTGIMIERWGIAIDHVISDFAAGAAEMLVEHVADRQIVFIEGQGSIAHPAYSGVTLSLLHGSCPDAMVICHRPGRTHFNEWPDCPIPSITEQIALYEHATAVLHPVKVVAVAVNTAGMSPEIADKEIRSLAEQIRLPTADPIRQGCAELLNALATV